MSKELFTIAASGALTALIACAPKPAERVRLVERACLEAAMAESSALSHQRQVDLVQSEIGEKEARLVELERLRSRIVTAKISDEELVQVELEPRREPPPVIQDTAQVVPLQEVAPTDTTQVGAPTQPTTGQEPSVSPEQTQPSTEQQQPATEEGQTSPSQGTGEQPPPESQTEQPTSSEPSGETTTGPAPESAP